jgi:hypothetical protein
LDQNQHQQQHQQQWTLLLLVFCLKSTHLTTFVDVSSRYVEVWTCDALQVLLQPRAVRISLSALQKGATENNLACVDSCCVLCCFFTRDLSRQAVVEMDDQWDDFEEEMESQLSDLKVAVMMCMNAVVNCVYLGQDTSRSAG